MGDGLVADPMSVASLGADGVLKITRRRQDAGEATSAEKALNDIRLVRSLDQAERNVVNTARSAGASWTDRGGGSESLVRRRWSGEVDEQPTRAAR
jgi:hypothetical protein